MGICAFFYMWQWFGVVVFKRYTVNWGVSVMGICAFFYMWQWFGVLVFQRCMVNYWGANEREREEERLCPYLKWSKWWNGLDAYFSFLYFLYHRRLHISHSDIVYWCCSDLCLKVGGPSALGLYAFVSMSNSFRVVDLLGLWSIDWGVHLPWVYVQSICETHLV